MPLNWMCVVVYRGWVVGKNVRDQELVFGGEVPAM